MTTRQKITKALYPLIMFFSKLQKKKSIFLFNKENKKPVISFYSLTGRLNNGSLFSFEQLKGKKVLIVNTASDCGYTGQYEELEELYQIQKDKLIILGFPANDFGDQEKGSNEEIAQFCKINYGVTFPLMKKSTVIKKNGQNEIYQWLTNTNKNGWNNQPPAWNFSKYLINEEGILTHYFDPAVSPLSDELQKFAGR